MKFKYTRVLVRTIEVKSEWYPKGSTKEDILRIEKENANDDPEMLFSTCDEDIITVEIVEE